MACEQSKSDARAQGNSLRARSHAKLIILHLPAAPIFATVQKTKCDCPLSKFQLPCSGQWSPRLASWCWGKSSPRIFPRRSTLPFGPFIFNETAGAKLFDCIPWTVPLLWIVAIFNSRGVARLGLRPWRKTKNYGWWLIGLTAVLTVVFDLALEPVAARVKHFWLWQPTKLHITWHGASPLNFLGWAFVSLLILAFITPSLIKKQPGSSGAPDFMPFGLWLGAMTLFAASSAMAGLWPAVIVDAVLAGAATVFAIRGAKW